MGLQAVTAAGYGMCRGSTEMEGIGIMLKKFLACVNSVQRYEFFVETGAAQWNKEELMSVAVILGIGADENEDVPELYAQVLNELTERVQIAA